MLKYNKGLLLKFKKTFLHVPDTERKWYDIIIWWEIRRVLYNLIVGLTGLVWVGIFILLILLSAGEGEDLGDPFLAIFFVIIYGIAANVFYTFGWISEIINKSSKQANRRSAPDLFLSLLIFSVGFTLLFPPGITLLLILISILMNFFS